MACCLLPSIRRAAQAYDISSNCPPPPAADIITAQLPALLSRCPARQPQQPTRGGLLVIKDVRRGQTPFQQTEISTVHSLAVGVRAPPALCVA